VEKLVTVDPVQVLRLGGVNILPFKVAKGAVQANVKAYHNYYQQAKRVSVFQGLDAQGNLTGATDKVGGSLGQLLARIVVGGHMSSNAPSSQVRVDTDLKDAAEERDRVGADVGGDPLIQPGEAGWSLKGKDTNHLTVCWYAYRRAESDLG
jgi:hypothetical protein